MARTTEMRLMEIVVLQDDVSCVIELLGNKGNFEFQLAGNEGAGVTPLKELYDKLQSVRAYLGMDDLPAYREDSHFPQGADIEHAQLIIKSVEELRHQEAGLPVEDEGASARKELTAAINSCLDTHGKELERLLGCLSIGVHVQQVESSLESSGILYKISGWLPLADVKSIVEDLDSLTAGRVSICLYRPEEVASVAAGEEKVPVHFKHNKFVASFERMLFSYGSPQYGSIDATPLMAFFFPLLFGIMFGDAGQGLVLLLIGVLLSTGAIKRFPTWNKFGPIFMAVGCTSTIMGILTGEFFANNKILVPLSRFISGLWGEPHDHILHLMPSADTIGTVFMFFGFTLAIGFIMNSIGLVINMINQFSLGKPYKAIFGKTGLCGAVFFWYVVFMAIRVAVLGIPLFVGDWIVIGVSLLGACFGHPIERMLKKEKPVFEHGVGVGIIEGVVEILEIVSSYLSNTVSFLRVGAFGLAHAVLGFIIHTMAEMLGGAGGLAVMIIGNGIVIVLEGMIVAIQVVRLHYYEFFSKFFTETGREFKPFRFQYNVKV